MASMMNLAPTLTKLQNARAIIGHNPLRTRVFLGVTPKPFQVMITFIFGMFKKE